MESESFNSQGSKRTSYGFIIRRQSSRRTRRGTSKKRRQQPKKNVYRHPALQRTDSSSSVWSNIDDGDDFDSHGASGGANQFASLIDIYADDASTSSHLNVHHTVRQRSSIMKLNDVLADVQAFQDDANFAPTLKRPKSQKQTSRPSTKPVPRIELDLDCTAFFDDETPDLDIPSECTSTSTAMTDTSITKPAGKPASSWSSLEEDELLAYLTPRSSSITLEQELPAQMQALKIAIPKSSPGSGTQEEQFDSAYSSLDIRDTDVAPHSPASSYTTVVSDADTVVSPSTLQALSTAPKPAGPRPMSNVPSYHPMTPMTEGHHKRHRKSFGRFMKKVKKAMHC
ncbi:hypothetical protein HDU85_002465 [Gaertneriomyces sp. JEL0708]|nr:hypothetical protein HDU85_002465 [Gaertneriomyces sp. JEL0708]